METTSVDNHQRDEQPTYIYIVGRGHSGSTLLTLLLARHPSVAAAGELANLSLQIFRDEHTRWVGSCSCGERPSDCPVWSDVMSRVQDTFGVDLESDPFGWRISDVGIEEEHRRAAPFRAPFYWFRNRFWRILRYLQYLGPVGLRGIVSLYRPQKQWARNRSFVVRSFASVSKVSAVVDASKDPLDMRDLYENATLPVKVIFLTRDCRGNVWSMLKKLKNVNREHQRDSRIVSAAKAWVTVNDRIWKLIQVIPETNWMQLKYEDICRNPAETLEALFDFLELQYVDILSKDDILQQHTIGGNRIRFTNQKLEIREDTQWQEGLSSEDQQIIRQIALPVSEKLGYKFD